MYIYIYIHIYMYVWQHVALRIVGRAPCGAALCWAAYQPLYGQQLGFFIHRLPIE